MSNEVIARMLLEELARIALVSFKALEEHDQRMKVEDRRPYIELPRPPARAKK